MSRRWVVVLAAGLAACGGRTSAPATSSSGASGSAGTSAGGSTTGSSSGSTGGSVCPAPLLGCAGACVDPQSDPANCGSCGDRCPSGQVCSRGACASPCAPWQRFCTALVDDGGALGFCADVASDNANCGTCGNACGPTEVCASGACSSSCSSSQHLCPPIADGGRPFCAALDSDNLNCGACGNACGNAQLCQGGSCQGTCAAPQTLCPAPSDAGGAEPFCASLQSDNANCGACGNACAAPLLCALGSCSSGCAPDQQLCGAADGGARFCASVQSDNANCGACGNACVDGEVCSNGVCATGCASPQSLCTGGEDGGGVRAYCANLGTDNANCGVCGNRCGSGLVCTGANCASACIAGQTLCTAQLDGGGARYCAALDTDNANCGACGNACGGSESCQHGGCVVVCNRPSTSCVDDGGTPYCADLLQDVDNCGACGQVCAPAFATGACDAGQCTVAACSPGRGDCDGDPGNGCEAVFATDSLHCGGCGQACPVPPHAAASCADAGCGWACTGTFQDCDGDAGNGCESNALTDDLNCGGCGVQCGLGQYCDAGGCDGTPCVTDLDCPEFAYCGAAGCGPCFPASPDPIPSGGAFEQLATTLPERKYAAAVGYDPVDQVFWQVGGYAYQPCCSTCGNYCEVSSNTLAYFNLADGGTGELTGLIGAKNWNYNGNSAAFLFPRLWYATSQQVCNLDVVELAETCLPAWGFPSGGTDFPGLTSDGTNLFLVGGTRAYRFNVADALTGRDPWTDLAPPQYSHYDYPGVAYLDGWLYAIGGSYVTTNVERLYVGPRSDQPGGWQDFGSLPGEIIFATMVQAGQVVYIAGGEVDYNVNSEVIEYDLYTGTSQLDPNLYLNTWVSYASGAMTTPAQGLYVLGGYNWYDYPAYAEALIQHLSLPADPAHDVNGNGIANVFDDYTDAGTLARDICPLRPGYLCMGGPDGGLCGCYTAADCPAGLACDTAAHLCTANCDANQPCNGCCDATGTCHEGTSTAFCGSSGSCIDCSGSSLGSACNAGVCGCDQDRDCPGASTCSDLTCSCADAGLATLWCGSACIDPRIDDAHCGASDCGFASLSGVDCASQGLQCDGMAHCEPQGRFTPDEPVEGYPRAYLGRTNWTLCYDMPYSDSTSYAGLLGGDGGACPADLITNNNNKYDVLLGCYPTGSDELSVLAVLPGYVLYTYPADLGGTPYALYTPWGGAPPTYWFGSYDNYLGFGADVPYYYDFADYNCEATQYYNSYYSNIPSHLCWPMSGASSGMRCGTAVSQATDYNKVLYYRPHCDAASCAWCGQAGQVCCPDGPGGGCATDGGCVGGTCE